MQRNTATEDLTSVEWRDDEWIKRNGFFQNQRMVLDYFATSPFWDRQSNNQVLSMQTQFNDLGQSYEATLEALRKMTGIEFAIVHEVISTEPSTPNLWIIQKRYRRGPAPDDVNPIATYYIININIYQSPSIYSVIANRLLTSLFYVNSAFKETQDMMEFYPSRGYAWKTPPTNDTTISSKKAAATSPSSGDKDATIINTSKGVLRAQETHMFRRLMDRAIETSSQKIMQARQAIDTPEPTEDNNTLKPSASSIDLTASQNNREEVGGKRPRKKVDEGTGQRKKKAAK